MRLVYCPPCALVGLVGGGLAGRAWPQPSVRDLPPNSPKLEISLTKGRTPAMGLEHDDVEPAVNQG